MMLQRYVIIVATAFVGAWTVIVGGLAAAGGRGAARAAPAARRVDSVSADAGAGTAMGAVRVDRARADRHRRAAGYHGERSS